MVLVSKSEGNYRLCVTTVTMTNTNNEQSTEVFMFTIDLPSRFKKKQLLKRQGLLHDSF